MEYECQRKEIIDDMKKDLWGNGKKGLTTKVTWLQAQMYFMLLMDMAIIALLIKIIFFTGA